MFVPMCEMNSKKYPLIAFIFVFLLYMLFTIYQTENIFTLNQKASTQTRSLFNLAGFFRNLGHQSQISVADPSKPVPVLVLTYMRSGSSLTGDILQHSEGALYVYEPFRGLGHKDPSSYTLIYANGTVRKPPFSFKEETYNALYNWFTCNISKLTNIGLMDPFLKKGLKSRMFPICYQREMLKKNNQGMAIRMCARELQGICENSHFRIIKTIRLELNDVKDLLEDLPNLKIVHLVRDPRGTLASQARLGQCSERRGGQNGCTNRFCKRLENDVLAEEKIMEKYPNRIMPVFYEDIARYPLESSRKMYDFIGADFSIEVEEYIYNITMAGLDNDCAICTTRSNSSEHVDSWKYRMIPGFIDIVNERCNYVLKRYNFEEYPVKKK